MILDFVNKNMYRKYPIRGDMSCVSTIGFTLPTTLISAIRLTVPDTITSVFINKVNIVENFVSVSIADYSTENELGAFYGKVTSLFTSLPFVARPGINASGSLIVGEIGSSLKPTAVLWFSKTTAAIEPSCLTLVSPPAVTKLTDARASFCYGSVTTALDNLTITSGSNDFILQITDRSLTQTNGDFSGVYRNCDLPVIVKINTVTPDVNGNINIVGIVPLTVTPDEANSEIDLSSDLEITDVCPDLNKISPPTNNSTTYYTNILTTETPEWKTWPQYAV